MLDRMMVETRARRAYERARAVRAVWASVPLASIAVLAWLLGTPPGIATALGAFVVVLAFAAHYAGSSAARAVMPGVLAGLVPFALVHVGDVLGPVCVPGACTETCMAACAVGGLLAGGLVARAARHAAQPLASIATAGVLATAVGSMGCACIGLMGVAAVAASLALVSVPAVLVARTR